MNTFGQHCELPGQDLHVVPYQYNPEHPPVR